MFSVFVMIVVFICSKSQSQRYILPSNPCPNIFHYAYEGDGYIGIITLQGLTTGKTYINMELSQEGADTTNSGAITLNMDEKNILEYIMAGSPIPFKVSFPNRNIPPLVSAIRVNGMLVCTGPRAAFPRTDSTINYDMTVTPTSGMNYHNPMSPYQGDPNDLMKQREEFLRRVDQNRMHSSQPNSNMNLFKPITRFEDDPNFRGQYGDFLRQVEQNRHRMVNYPGQEGSFNPIAPRFDDQDYTHPTRPSSLDYINSVCGRQINNVVSQLMVHGQDLTIQTYPWMVAIYKKVDNSPTFFCAGNLISSRSVISAAHCFKEGTDTVSPDRLVFFLGLFRLSQAENAVNVAVQSILIHPDYKKQPQSLDADIAIVQLVDSVSFRDSILPICLWRGPIDNTPQNGLIVGWGEDENRRRHTDIPKYVTVNIVSDSACVRRKPEMVFITSNRTLCAGDLNGRGPCRGDSGSGLMININGKWLLRGIVSTALASRTTTCDLHEYVIFSDIAKFLDWIRTNMIL